jgi:membrane-associated phospholipid phosphatase
LKISYNQHAVQQKRQSGYWIGIMVLALLAALFSFYAGRSARLPGDLGATQWVQSFDSSVLLSVMQWISALFDGWPGAALIIGSALLVWWRIGLLEGLLVTLAGVVSLLDRVLKLLIDQPRPSASLVHVLVAETGTGFPSGHAMFSILWLGTSAYILYIYFAKASWRFSFLIIGVLLILLVGFSRVYLGVHWASQVVGGYLIGGILLLALIRLYTVLTAGREKN